MEQWRRGDPPSGVQFDEFRHLDGLPRSAYRDFVEQASRLGLVFLSTPFDEGAVDLLDEAGVPAFKIASGDLTAHPFVRYVAARQRPLLLATGCATIAEIEETLDVIYATGNRQVALLHCTLAYPCHDRDANLNMMKTLQVAFPDVPIGLSDHTLGTLVPALAASHGACVIEKHFTLDKSLPTSTDHFMSVDPPELASMVRDIRSAERAMGAARKQPVPVEQPALLYARRSVVARVDIAAGDTIRREHLALKRPGTGIAPKYVDAVAGRRTARAIPADTVMTWDMLA